MSGGRVELDRYAVALLVLRPDAPQLGEAEAIALQEAHMAYLADLHEAGHLLAAGPLDDPSFRGLSVLAADPGRARELKERDPAVVAGRFAVEVMTWHVPKGAVRFAPTRFPRALAEIARG